MAPRSSAVPKALGCVVALYALLWVFGYALSANRWVYQLYHLNFETSTAHRLARALAETQIADDDVCLLLGPSTVKEGFDTHLMSSVAPEIHWVNGGTAGGTIWILTAVTEMVRQSKVRPACIVVGINGRMLVSRKIGLDQHGYTDFLDLANGRELLAREIETRHGTTRRELVANTLWPYRRPARQIGRLLRLGWSSLHSATLGDGPPASDEADDRRLTVADFELVRDELQLAAPFRWEVARSMPREYQERLEVLYEREGLLDPDRVARPEHVAALREILEDLEAISRHLVVIRMPERSYGRRNFQPLSVPAMAPVLAELEARGACVLDRTADFPDEALRDMGHMTIPAREIFSRDMALEIRHCMESENGAT